MKKLLCCVLALLLVSVLGCALAAGETTTLLVYICGADQEAACDDIDELCDVDAGEGVSIVILAGGSKEWDFEDFKGGSRTLAVLRGGELETLEDWGKASMGSPECLEEFLAFGLTEYPADRTVVVLWDHGAGSEGGVCFDETAGDDCLTLVEINGVLENLSRSVPDWHIDILGFDACMMATYEMAAMLSGHSVDYFVGSEETEPQLGWYYAGILDALKNDPAISDADLCANIIEDFIGECLKSDPEDFMTLSAVDLSKMDPLKSSMERFASVLSGQLEDGNLSALRRARSRMYTIGSFDDASWDMVDLGAALDAYASFDPETAAEAKRALSRAVVLSRQTDNLDPFSGLSILIPQDTTSDFRDYKAGIDLSGVIPNWLGFLDGYVDMLLGGSYQITASGATQITEGSGFFGSLISSSASSGSLEWDDESESYGEEIPPEEITVSDSDRGFTATLSQEDLANLDYVEGMLLMDISDGESEGYVDFGLMRNNLIDWQNGTVVSLYDGAWPVFGGKPVPLYDQTSNEHSRRSLIPVKLNGEYTYLVVVFPAGGTEGRIIGANAGYDDSGLPIRSTTALKPGDEIVPVYTMYYEEEGKDDLQKTEFDGEAIVWQDGMTVAYEDLSDDTEPAEMLFCFVFNDIFGEDSMSEFISFQL